MRKSQKYYWKACKPVEIATATGKDIITKYYSLCRDEPKFQVEYKIGEFVYPIFPGSKLCIFETLKQANAFAEDYRSVVFKVEVINPTDIVFLSGSTSEMEDLWNRIKKDRKFVDLLMRPPEGTLQCDAVKLVTEERSFNCRFI